MSIGEEIKKKREEKIINQSKLARLAGVGRATLWRVEEGRNSNIVTINKILKAIEDYK